MNRSDIADVCGVLAFVALGGLTTLAGFVLTVLALRWAFTVPLFGGC
jgi:hypothetical protein